MSFIVDGFRFILLWEMTTPFELKTHSSVADDAGIQNILTASKNWTIIALVLPSDGKLALHSL